MNEECEVIRDLLPLYADEVCSAKSREIVETHIQTCPECRTLMGRYLDDRIEKKLESEKADVIAYGERRLRQQSALNGGLMTGLAVIVIVAALIIGIATNASLGLLTVIISAMAVAGSLIAVPIIVPKHKALWTLAAFTASLQLLLGVTCIWTHGDWFWIASSATLFGLSMVFLPFVVHAKPVKALIGGASKFLVVLGLDAALFVNMMNMIFSDGHITLSTVLYSLAVIAGIGMAALEIIRKRGNRHEQE